MLRPLLVVLAVLGVALTLTAVPGAFTIDEANYLSTLGPLREGRLTLATTAGLPASRELVWFDPQAHIRKVERTPVTSTAPPLWAPLALPFSFASWRGLVALNTLAFLGTALLVFLYARRWADDAAGALAAAAFALGGYALEYAQGLWPHSLSVLMTTGAAYCTARLRDGGRLAWAALAGLLAGWATGIRYQNLVFALALLVGLALLARRRWAAGGAFAGAFAVPLAAASALNHARLGSWNPVSKGPTYLGLGGRDDGGGGLLGEALVMAWARIVDFAQRPPLEGLAASYLSPHPESGAYVLGGVVKKAWLQSAPWLAPALVALVAVWLVGRSERRELRREMRALSLVVFAVLAAFALAGAHRTDGWSYNQRYFLELVPLAAVAFAWTLRHATARQWRALAGGGLAGVALAAAVLWRPADAPVRHLAVLYLPLALAAALLALAALERLRPTRRAAAIAAGVCLGWALALHLGEDVLASRAIRRHHQERFAHVDRAVPEGSALLAFWGNKDAYAPWLLGRDVVVVDPFADRGETVDAVTAALLAQGRRVFVVPPFPRPLLARAAGAAPLRALPSGLIEIGGEIGGGPAREGDAGDADGAGARR